MKKREEGMVMVYLLKIKLFVVMGFLVLIGSIWVSIYDCFGPGRPVTHQNVMVSNSKKLRTLFFFFNYLLYLENV